MHHSVKIQRHENNAIKEMLTKAAKVNTKVKTKGRFAVEIPTNGTLNRVDTAWA